MAIRVETSIHHTRYGIRLDTNVRDPEAPNSSRYGYSQRLASSQMRFPEMLWAEFDKVTFEMIEYLRG